MVMSTACTYAAPPGTVAVLVVVAPVDTESIHPLRLLTLTPLLLLLPARTFPFVPTSCPNIYAIPIPFPAAARKLLGDKSSFAGTAEVYSAR